ncbi:hypothetical protein DXG01_005703 [Tephrocybe rancida]|nr:hypothetical protein DXG01_005703 [Tephrocybe rancida]
MDLRQSEFADSIYTAFSPNGQHLVTVVPDNGVQGSHSDVRVWDVQQQQEVIKLRGLEGKDFVNLRNFAFSSYGLRVAAHTSSEGTIFLWHLKSGPLQTTYRKTHPKDTTSKEAADKKAMHEETRWKDATTKDIMSWENAQLNITDLYFTDDNELATKVHKKESTLWSWEAEGTLTPVTKPKDRLVEAPGPFFNPNDIDIHNNITHHGMHWIPFRTSNAGLWAFVNNHTIRVQPDGTMVIVSISSGRRVGSII